jgi:hypothetical protein
MVNFINIYLQTLSLLLSLSLPESSFKSRTNIRQRIPIPTIIRNNQIIIFPTPRNRNRPKTRQSALQSVLQSAL